eukprot:gene339-190_t
MPSRVPYHLVATDMDGTLLNKNHEVTPFSKHILQKLVQVNPYTVCVALVSGRPHTDLAHLLNSLDLPEESGFIISSNGARVHRRVKGPGGEMKLEEIYAKTVPSEDLDYLLSLLPDDLSGFLVHIFQGERWLSSAPCDEELVYFQKSGFRYEMFDPKGADPLEGATKVTFSASAARKAEGIALFEKIKAERPHLLTSYASPDCMEDRCLDATPAPPVGREVPAEAEGSAVWGMKDCIAFGDADNDVDMLRDVGRGCAMKNASEYLRRQLPDVERIGSNEEDAVAKTVQEVFRLEPRARLWDLLRRRVCLAPAGAERNHPAMPHTSSGAIMCTSYLILHLFDLQGIVRLRSGSSFSLHS